MMAFKIEQNIEIPQKRRATTTSALDQFPFQDMKPGDSFTVPGKKMGDTLRNAASQYAATHDRWFYVTRTVGVAPESIQATDEEGELMFNDETGAPVMTRNPEAGEVLTRIWRVQENDPRRRVARY